MRAQRRAGLSGARGTWGATRWPGAQGFPAVPLAGGSPQGTAQQDLAAVCSDGRFHVCIVLVLHLIMNYYGSLSR